MKGKAKRFIWASLFATTCLAAPTYAFDKTDGAQAVGSVGASVFKLWMQEKNIKFQKPELGPEAQSAILEQALSDYSQLRNSHYEAIEAGTKIKLGIQLGSAAVAIKVPPLAVPAVIYSSIMSSVIDTGNEAIEAHGRKHGAEMLAASLPDILRVTNLPDLDAAKSNPNFVRDALRNNNALLTDLKDRANASGDDVAVDFAVDVMMRSLAQNDQAFLDGILQNTQNVSELTTDFEEFTLKTSFEINGLQKRATSLEVNLSALSNATVTLQANMAQANTRLTNLEEQQSFVSDFVFSKMPPREKVLALQSGFLANRFNCEDGGTGCGAAQTKASLIAEYKAQAKLADAVETAGDIVQGINDIRGIAGNLGLDLGEDVNKLLDVGSAAASAVVSFYTGNPLGAINAITSVFGGRKDPDAERFKIMMAYLQEQFGIINSKLDSVLENQKLIYDAIVAMNEHLDARLTMIDQQLFRMEFEQQRIGIAVRALH